MEAATVRMAVARTASWAGNRLLNSTVSGTQVAAAKPVMARPTSNPCALLVVPMTHAPRPERRMPARMKGLRRPSQSAAMPSGRRTIACHKPYCARMMPKNARLSVLLAA